MKFFISVFIYFSISSLIACEHLKTDGFETTEVFMGKKSKFYDAYKQGKCLIDNALQNVPVEQRSVIAKLIARSYNTESAN